MRDGKVHDRIFTWGRMATVVVFMDFLSAALLAVNRIHQDHVLMEISLFAFTAQATIADSAKVAGRGRFGAWMKIDFAQNFFN